MSKPVEQHTLISEQHNHTEESDENATAAMNAIEEHKEEEKPQIVIKGSDLEMVMKECCLGRQEAIDLIQKAHGDIKLALKMYLHDHS